MRQIPTISPGRCVMALTALTLGLASELLAALAGNRPVSGSVVLLGLVTAAGLAQPVRWLGVATGVLAGFGYAYILSPGIGVSGQGSTLAGSFILAGAGILAELAGRQIVRIERALALGEKSIELGFSQGNQPRPSSTPGGACGLSRELERARRYHFDVALALIEIGDWNSQVRSQGSARMVEVLAEFGRRLRESLRIQDELSYITGGRFALVLPHTGGSGAQAVVERARQIAARLGGLTLYVGVAEFPQEAATEEELLSEAEAALDADRRTQPTDSSERSLITAG